MTQGTAKSPFGWGRRLQTLMDDNRLVAVYTGMGRIVGRVTAVEPDCIVVRALEHAPDGSLFEDELIISYHYISAVRVAIHDEIEDDDAKDKWCPAERASDEAVPHVQPSAQAMKLFQAEQDGKATACALPIYLNGELISFEEASKILPPEIIRELEEEVRRVTEGK